MQCFCGSPLWPVTYSRSVLFTPLIPSHLSPRSPFCCQRHRHSSAVEARLLCLCHPPSMLTKTLFLCVCLRLADRHVGLAVRGGNTYPDLLPCGTGVAVLWIQTSLLQASGRDAVLCRYVRPLTPSGRAEKTASQSERNADSQFSPDKYHEHHSFI